MPSEAAVAAAANAQTNGSMPKLSACWIPAEGSWRGSLTGTGFMWRNAALTKLGLTDLL